MKKGESIPYINNKLSDMEDKAIELIATMIQNKVEQVFDNFHFSADDLRDKLVKGSVVSVRITIHEEYPDDYITHKLMEVNGIIDANKTNLRVPIFEVDFNLDETAELYRMIRELMAYIGREEPEESNYKTVEATEEDEEEFELDESERPSMNPNTKGRSRSK